MPERKTQALAEFDRWSRTYDRSVLQRLLFKPSHALLLGQVLPTDERLLDIGCGTGQFAARLLAARPQMAVCGLDLSGLMLAHAVTRCAQWPGRFLAVRGEGSRLPFADDTFDVVTCSHSFHHYPDQAGAVAEMYRVLRPDGRLLLIDGDRDQPWGWLIFDVCVTWAEGAVHHCSGRRFRELFREAGFCPVTQLRRGSLAPFICTVGRAAKPARVVPQPVRQAA